MRRLILFLLLASPAFAQTNVGGFASPTPWPSVPMSGNDVLNGGMENCTGGPCAPGNLTLSNWTAGSGCTIIADNTHVHTGSWAMEIGPCGSGSANGLIQQAITYQGLGRNLDVCYYLYTDASFTAPGGNDGPIKDTTHGNVDLSDDVGLLNGWGNGGVQTAIPTNSQGWFRVCREDIINQFAHTNDSWNFQIRWPIPGITGHAWMDDVKVTENDDPIRLFVNSDMDGAKGYFWNDLAPDKHNCGVTTAGTVCGEVELNVPSGSSGLTVAVSVGTNSTCTAGATSLLSGSFSTGTQPWSFNTGTLGITTQSSPTTPYYICSSATDNTTSTVYVYPPYKWYPLGATFRATLTNWIDEDQTIVKNGVRQMIGGAYDSCTANNCSTANVFSIGSPGTTGNAVTSYQQLWAGMGFAAPQSTSAASHNAQQIKGNGPYRVVDYANNYFNYILNFVDMVTASPIAGTGDQLGPYLQNLGNYGMQHVQISNVIRGTGWDGAAAITSATVPPAPSAPTLSSTGGNIKSSQYGAGNYAWIEECPTYQSPLGQTGNTPTPGTCSAGVASTNTIPSSSTISIPVAMEACNNFSQHGWIIKLGFSASNSTAPSEDVMYPVMDANTTAQEGEIFCTSQGGPSTVTIIGSPGDGDSAGREFVMLANSATQPSQPANAPAVPTIVVNGATGSTSWTYACTAVYTTPETQQGSTASVSNGNATLTGSNFNAVTCPSVPNASGENVYRTAHGTGGSPTTTGKIGSVANGGTLNDTGIAASGSAPTANTLVEIQQVSPGILSQASTPLAVVAGTTITGPGCTGAGTGHYVSEASGASTTGTNPWKYFIQESPGSPLGCTGTFVVPAFTSASQEFPAPTDFTPIGRTTWDTGLSDATIISDYASLATGSDAANYPKAGAAFLGTYCSDEANPVSDNFFCNQQNLSSTGFMTNAPGLLSFAVDVTPASYKYIRDSVDVPQQDPYCCGKLATSDPWVNGDACRNDLAYRGLNNTAPTLVTGCSSGQDVFDVQLTDTAEYGCMIQSYGTRPCPLVLQQFPAIAALKGFVYGTIRRACWKGIIIATSFGNNGGGCIWWNWGNGSGMDEIWYTYGNTNAYQDQIILDAQTFDPELQRTLHSPTIDGSAPTAMVGIHSPGIGQIITAVSFTQTTQAACSPTTMTANSYLNTTRYPYAPLAFAVKKDPATGDILFGLNDLCGSANSNSTGGAPNVAVITLNPSAIPAGATQIEWVGGDLNGNNVTVIGSNATCPAATVGANQFCMVMNDQEADFAWLRVPRQNLKSGNITESGKISSQ